MMTRAGTEENYPLASIIIPTYNQEKYLRQSIESALSQDYPNFEVIVVDNGSTDNTPGILASFGNKIKHLKEAKRGVSIARNKGLQIARGEFVTFLDSDDLFLPEKLALSIKQLQKDRSISMVYTDYIRIDAENRLIEESKLVCPSQEEFTRKFLTRGILPGVSVIRKSCFEKVGLFNEAIPANLDCEMGLRLLKNGYRFGHIPRALYAYRLHSDNLTRDLKLARYWSDYVRLEAIKNFTEQELFGDFVKNNNWREAKRGYEKLARKFYRRRLFAAAEAALEKSAGIKAFSPRLFISIPLLKLKIGFRKNSMSRWFTIVRAVL